MSRKATTTGEAPFTESVPELGRRLLGLGRQKFVRGGAAGRNSDD